MKQWMKHFRKIAWMTVLFIFVFMSIALLRFQRTEEEEQNLPDQIEYYLDYEWRVTKLENGSFTYGDLKEEDKLSKIVQDAFADGQYKNVDLPYDGKSSSGDLVVFKSFLPQNYAGLTLSVPSQKSFVFVVLDGKVIYQYGPTDELDKDTVPESNLNFMALPRTFQDGELYVAFLSPLKN